MLLKARADHIVLLNNDTVVTDGWLDQLLSLADSQASIGAVGPMSNYVSPPQLIPEPGYADMESMHAFAARWRVEHRGQWFTSPKLSGFCLLLKRYLLDEIGRLDESFGLGLFDDDDLCRRVVQAGYELAVAHDLFIHHYGSRTFIESGVDTARLLKENQALYASKWNIPPEGLGQAVTLRSWGEPQASPSRQSRVSLVMIVRNEEDNLPRCLESVGGLFDEIVIVDTGSTDATREIALAHGATVFEFPWIDDFAAARNEALKHSTGDYAFWLDADDRIDPPDHEKLGRLFNGLSRENRSAYVVRCACDSAPDGRVQGTVVDHVRLFPLRADVLWTYPVHEQILPALRRADVPLEWTDIVVRHTGYVDEAVRRRKLDRDSRILERLLEESPDEPFVRFNLGFIAVEKSEWKKALGHFQASLDRSAPEDSITRKLYALIARCQQALGSPDEALATCEDGLRLEPDDAELWFRKAVVLRTTGGLEAARACWEHVLTLRRPEKFSSVDVGIYGHLTRRNLARIAEERRDWPTARLHWLETLRECPDDEEATAALRMLESHGGEGSR